MKIKSEILTKEQGRFPTTKVISKYKEFKIEPSTQSTLILELHKRVLSVEDRTFAAYLREHPHINIPDMTI